MLGVQIITTTPEELAALVESAVAEALAKRNEIEPWLDTDAAAAYLSTTPPRLRDLARRSSLPHHRTAGGRLMFRPSELDRWVTRGDES